MKATSVAQKEQQMLNVSAVTSVQVLPLEVANLLRVFARIEARRQEKLRASSKEVA